MLENDIVKLPEVIVFAGPNGSGKTTITGMAKTVGEYINADDIKRTILCSDIEAAIKAEELRERMIEQRQDFTFETVLSYVTFFIYMITRWSRSEYLRSAKIYFSDGQMNFGMSTILKNLVVSESM